MWAAIFFPAYVITLSYGPALLMPIPALFVVTLLMTVPVAWVLHRFTRVRT